MYYGLILVTTLMSGVQIALVDLYRRLRGGSGWKISFQSSLIGSVFGLVLLSIMNGGVFEFTMFSFLLAAISAVAAIGGTCVGLKALDKVNLSLYSMAMMIGGMVLPFVQGILFYGEQVTAAKSICFLCIAIAMILTFEKGQKKGKLFYYIFIFILNGLNGVFQKIFVESPVQKTSEIGFMMLMLLCSIIIALALLVFLGPKEGEQLSCNSLEWKSVTCAAIGGSLYSISNYLLVIALAHVDSTIQYPMVSGGVMIVSTCLCYFTEKKPRKREWLAVFVAFAGMLALFMIRV